jgi:hypothetical protein
MPLISVPAIYDGEQIRLLEAAPVGEPYRVLVTFIEPAGEEESPLNHRDRFWSSFGAWQDDGSVEDTIDTIYRARRSKSEPPPL